jgi:hypothetical protein
MKRRITLAAALAATALVLAACGSSSGNHHDMPGMAMSHDNGLSATKDGYTLEVKHGPMTGMPVSFAILKDGKPVTSFETEQTKQAHFYLIRSDLSGFQHLHPTMAVDGAWSAQPAELSPGDYRLYVQVTPAGTTEPIVLSRAATVAGSTSSQALPSASTTTTVDGYTLALSGQPTNGKELQVNVTKDGKPVTDLQPYLETYAHVTAFRQGNLAFAHLHPLNRVKGPGGPKLRFMVEIEETGTYRLFIQFMTGGVLHTASVTTTVA